MAKNPVQYIKIQPDFAGQRIDNFLITFLKGVPKTRIYRIVRKGEVRVNKKRIEPSYRLIAGDEIRIPPVELKETEDMPTPGKKITQLLAESVLYEDKNLLIINKPSGLPVHGGSQVKLGLVEILKQIYTQSPHLELAHRLDADTSGCLILAKKRSILKEIHELLREGKMVKEYLLLTKGHWQQNELIVDAPLLKNILSSGERIVKVNKEGKTSITHFEPITDFKEASLMKAKLLTGRTHQIRVHALYKRHPLAGDEKYGDKEFNKQMKEKGLKRLFLHAHRVSFTLKSLAQTIEVTSPLDKDLEKVLVNLTQE